MGFELNIDIVMLRIFGLELYWYGFAYSLGFASLSLWFLHQRTRLGWSSQQVVDSSIIFIVAILAGGRVFDIAVYEWTWYRDHPWQMPMLWKGGLASHGLMIGAVAAACVVSHMTNIRLLRLLDSLTVAAAVIFGVGRVGNFIEVGVIGTLTNMPWGVKLPDVDGFRHPVSLYDGLKNLFLVPLLLVVLRYWPPGRGIATGVFLLGYGGLRFIVDLFRDYESAFWGIGPGQWYNLAMAVAGLALLLYLARNPVREDAGTANEHRDSGTARRPPTLAVAALVGLILFPLSIPTSWTREYIQMKREQEQSRISRCDRDRDGRRDALSACFKAA